jgi:hypothetical protein
MSLYKIRGDVLKGQIQVRGGIGIPSNPATGSCRSRFECSCHRQRHFPFLKSPGRVSQGLVDVFLQLRVGFEDPSRERPAARRPITMLTVTRRPRMQALPPITAGSRVMRVRWFTGVFANKGKSMLELINYYAEGFRRYNGQGKYLLQSALEWPRPGAM